MKIIITLLYCGLIFFFSHSQVLQIAETAKDVIKKADEKMRGKTSQSEMTIKIVRPTWSREMKMKAWSKETTYAMILVTSPAKEKGTVFLKSDKEVWNWVPSIERVIKLPPSMMTQSWMGTDFTNDDLVKESSIVDDYVHSFLGDSIVEGRLCYKIQLIPKPEAAVVWGKIVVWIDKKDFIQMRAEFYDEENTLINTMQSSDVKIMGGRLIPTKLEMIPADKIGQKTVMIYSSISFDQPIDQNFFTTQNMKKVK
ncbi:MAG: outer membrane lipoprotein-sorting protein [Bacteroidota bacterium]